MSHLPRTLKEALVSRRDPLVEARVWRRIEASFEPARAQRRRAPSPVPTRVVGWTALAAALAVVVGLGWFGWSHLSLEPVGPLTLMGGGRLEARSAVKAEVVVAGDGSRLELLAGARVEPLENTASTVVLKQARGRVAYDIKPGGPRRWSIECGVATVEVVGTSFVVEREPRSVHVEVSRGVVLVRSEYLPDRVERLVAGGALDVNEPAQRVEVALSSAQESETPPDLPTSGEGSAMQSPAVRADAEARPARGAGPSGVSAAAVTRARKDEPGPSGGNAPSPSMPGEWRRLADEGEHTAAYQELGAQGVARASADLSSIEDLLRLADVARLSGHPAEAVPPLERVVVAYPADARSSLAAFTLGKIELDVLGAPVRAVGAFHEALRLGLRGGLREDAYLRVVEAEVRAGNPEAAGATAREYAAAFPKGTRGAAIRRWLDRP